MGRDVLFRFLTFERMVGFLRLVTAGQGLSDMAAQVRVLLVRPPRGSREVLVLFSQVATAAVDAAAQAARTAQGQGYTGASRHFAALRDARSPLGYDVSAISPVEGDYVLYGHEGESAYKTEGEMSLSQLILRLELLREHVRPEGLAAQELPPVFFLTARQGVGGPLCSQLHRSGVRAEAVLADVDPADIGRASRFWLFRIEHAPRRFGRLLRTTPGLEMFVPVTDTVAVAAGYRHPLHLDACRSVLDGDRMVLLSPPPFGPRVLEPAPRLSALDDLIRLGGASPPGREVTRVQKTQVPDLAVELKLEPGLPRLEAPVAALVANHQIPFFERLCYALPESVLARYRVALVGDLLLVVASDTLDWFPFGQLLTSAGRGILVPMGKRLRPAVSPALLVERLGTADGSLVVFRGADEAPFRIAADALEPLERRLLGELTVAQGVVRTPRVARQDDGSPEINYTGSFLPVWGSR
jgi:hypothetical protein